MKLEQFKTIEASVLIVSLMDAQTNNAQDAFHALRRAYDFTPAQLNTEEGDIFEYDDVYYTVKRTEDGEIHVSAEMDGWTRKLCKYTESSCIIYNEPAVEKVAKPEEEKPFEPQPDENPEPANLGPAAEAMESKVNEQLSDLRSTSVGDNKEDTVREAMEESMVKYTPGEGIDNEVKEGENTQPTPSDSEEETPAETTSIGSRLEIPEIDNDDAMARESMESEEETVLSLADHKPTDYIKMLFGDQYVTWVDVKRYLWENDYREAAYKLTGTIPVEHCVVYDDYTFSIINLNGGNAFRIMVAVTDDNLDSHEFLDTYDIKDRWMFVTDISNNTAFNYGQFQEIVRTADWGVLKPGTMVNL